MTGIHDYSDIINLPRPEPKRHTRMSLQARAAQFAPFAALTGFGDVIDEVSRTTEDKPHLDESVHSKINQNLMRLKSRPKEQAAVRVRFFLPDMKKSGGKIETTTAKIKKVDDYQQTLILADGKKIPFADILDLEIESGKTQKPD